MDCEKYQELASAFADGCLGDGEIAGLQGHLKSCDECEEFLRGIYRVRDFLRGEELRSGVNVSSPGFAETTTRAAFSRAGEHAPALRPFRSSLRRWQGFAAAAMLVLAAGWLLYRPSPGDEPVRMAATGFVEAGDDEGSMASYMRQHTIQTIDATYLGFSEGIELAAFETGGPGRE